MRHEQHKEESSQIHKNPKFHSRSIASGSTQGTRSVIIPEEVNKRRRQRVANESFDEKSRLFIKSMRESPKPEAKRSKLFAGARCSTAVKRWYTKRGIEATPRPVKRRNQQEGKGNRERERKRKRESEKELRKFPSPRRRPYNKTIVFRASGARSNKGVRQSENILQNNISRSSKRRQSGVVVSAFLAKSVSTNDVSTRASTVYGFSMPSNVASEKSNTTLSDFLRVCATYTRTRLRKKFLFMDRRYPFYPTLFVTGYARKPPSRSFPFLREEILEIRAMYNYVEWECSIADRLWVDTSWLRIWLPLGEGELLVLFCWIIASY